MYLCGKQQEHSDITLVISLWSDHGWLVLFLCKFIICCLQSVGKTFIIRERKQFLFVRKGLLGDVMWFRLEIPFIVFGDLSIN